MKTSDPLFQILIDAKLRGIMIYRDKLTEAQRCWKRSAKWSAYALKLRHKSNLSFRNSWLWMAKVADEEAQSLQNRAIQLSSRYS